jgi:Predicted permease.
MLTSLSFYFVAFSIDGNMARLNALTTLTENQQLYKNALHANTTLAYTFLASTIGLTSFVFAMFFYRIYRANKKQLGCIKQLGFKDGSLCACFVIFVAVLSTIGALLGLAGGYFLSDILIHANTNTYTVTGLVKEVSLSSLIAGLVVSTAIFCFITILCYSFIRGKEPGVLIAGNGGQARFSLTLRAAHYFVHMIPVKNKFPLRIALRKPLSIFLIITAVMSFNVCMILGKSLNISSQKIFDSQTIGHNYEYDTEFSEYKKDIIPENGIPYLSAAARARIGDHEINLTVTGLYNLNKEYELQNTKGDILSLPRTGTVYVNPGLREIYGIKTGDLFTVEIAGISYKFTVAAVAYNAKSDSIYMNVGELSQILGVPAGTYNGILSKEKINGGMTVNKEQRIEELKREAVSSNISAVINQSIGGLVGAILIFLALYINFQDNTRDMLILHMMGYRTKQINKLLMNVYIPIVWTAYLLTLEPSILLTRSIQKSLSISTNDYMPFGTNAFVLVFMFIGLSIIYWLVQVSFRIGIKRVIAKEELSEFVYAE